MESSDAIRNQDGDADPLLAFEAETFDSDAAAENPAHSSAMTTPINLDLAAVLRSRISDAENVLQKSQDTIAALHTRVETLVCAVADLNKRLDRERSITRVQNAMPSLRRDWPRTLPTGVLAGEWRRALAFVEWRRMLADEWRRVSVAEWRRVLPQDWQRALIAGTAIVMSTLAIGLVALLQGFDATLPPALPPAQAATADTLTPKLLPANTPPPPAVTPVREPAHAAPAQPVRKGSRPRVLSASAPLVTDSANASVAPPRTGRYVGTLTIDSDPPGNAFVNRRRVGRTPVTVEDLRAGSHLIWIEREGYRRWTRVVEVPANRISRVSIALEPEER